MGYISFLFWFGLCIGIAAVFKFFNSWFGSTLWAAIGVVVLGVCVVMLYLRLTRRINRS